MIVYNYYYTQYKQRDFVSVKSRCYILEKLLIIYLPLFLI